MEGEGINFIFEEGVDKDHLRQGDLLFRTPKLSDSIKQAHAHYANAPTYTHFLVLSQSCDLVPRKGGKFKANYITICAVRPLSIAVEREFSNLIENIDGCPVPVGSSVREIQAKQYLERVLNNTVDGQFFIPKGSTPTVTEHLCAFLPLSIALKADHYDTCLSAKVAQMREIFAAKVGSLASNLYGRVATPDLDEVCGNPSAAAAYRTEFFNELGLGTMLWLTPLQRSLFAERLLKQRETAGRDPTNDEVRSILSTLPTLLDLMADRVAEVLVQRRMLALPADLDETDQAALSDATNSAAMKVRNFIRNDHGIARLTKLGR